MTRNPREEIQHRGELGTRAIQSAQRQAMKVDFALRAMHGQHPVVECDLNHYRESVTSCSLLHRFSVNQQLDILLANIPHGGTMVDWGTGEAVLYEPGLDFWWGNLQRRGVTMTPIELNPAAIQSAVRSSRMSADTARRHISQEDPPYHAVQDHTLDAGVGISSFHLIPNSDIPAVLTDFRRMLKPGAPLVHSQPIGVTPYFLQNVDQQTLNTIEERMSAKYNGMGIGLGDRPKQNDFWSRYGRNVAGYLRNCLKQNAEYSASGRSKFPMNIESCQLTDILSQDVLSRLQTAHRGSKGIQGILEHTQAIYASMNSTTTRNMVQREKTTPALLMLDNLIMYFFSDVFNHWLAVKMEEQGYSGVKIHENLVYTPGAPDSTRRAIGHGVEAGGMNLVTKLSGGNDSPDWLAQTTAVVGYNT